MSAIQLETLLFTTPRTIHENGFPDTLREARSGPSLTWILVTTNQPETRTAPSEPTDIVSIIETTLPAETQIGATSSIPRKWVHLDWPRQKRGRCRNGNVVRTLHS